MNTLLKSPYVGSDIVTVASITLNVLPYIFEERYNLGGEGRS